MKPRARWPACFSVSSWVTASGWLPVGKVKRRVADKAKATFKQRVRKLTRRSGGRKPRTVVETTAQLCAGVEGIFFGWRIRQRSGASWTKWIRHRMRVHPTSSNGGAAGPPTENCWREGTSPDVCVHGGGKLPPSVAGTVDRALNAALGYKLGRSTENPETLLTSTSRTAGCGPACPVVGQGRAVIRSPYADLLFL